MKIWRNSDKDFIGFIIIICLILAAGGFVVALFVLTLRSIKLKEKLNKEREIEEEKLLISKWRTQTLGRKKICCLKQQNNY